MHTYATYKVRVYRKGTCNENTAFDNGPGIDRLSQESVRRARWDGKCLLRGRMGDLWSRQRSRTRTSAAPEPRSALLPLPQRTGHGPLCYWLRQTEESAV